MKSSRNFLRRSTIERLENRALMAAGITASMSDGLLLIRGTDQADNIYVRQIGDTLRVDGIGETFDARSVQAVRVDARGGDDYVRLDIDGQIVTKPSLIDAGAGSDHIRGGAASDYVMLGAGDDIAVTHAGNDIVYGGSGNDRVWTGEGSDNVAGGAGNDEIVLGNGDDFAAGGAGHDKIWGEAGRDVLDGGDGDDMLSGGAGDDELFGGAGSDSLYGDSGLNRLDEAGDARASMTSVGLDANLRLAIDAAILQWIDAGDTGRIVRHFVQPGFIAVPSPQQTSASPFAEQLTQNGLSPAVASYLGQYLASVQQQVGSSLLTPQGVAANPGQSVAPVGNTGLVSRPTEQSEWNSPNLTVSQALAIMQLLGPEAANNYLNYMISADSRRDLMTAFGYGQIANLTGSSADAQRILNDPFISLISGQALHNGVVDYITDRHGQTGVHNMDLQGIANDFGVNSGHLSQLLALPGMQPSRPAGSGSGSPFIDMLGAPIGSNPVDRYTYNGSQSYSPWNGGSTTAAMPNYGYGSYQTTVSPHSYGLPYNSSGVFNPTSSMMSYGNVYANPWNW
jgi:hypothetical protein